MKRKKSKHCCADEKNSVPEVPRATAKRFVLFLFWFPARPSLYGPYSASVGSGRSGDPGPCTVTDRPLNGTATLSGIVESIDEKDRVNNAAWAAPGISKVVDNLEVFWVE